MLTEQEIERLRNARDEIKNEMDALERQMAELESMCEAGMVSGKLTMRRLREVGMQYDMLRDNLNAIYDRLPLEMYDED